MKKKQQPAFDQKYQKIEQIAELTPGIISWLIILAPIWLTLISPRAAVALIAFIFTYITGIAILFLLGLIFGFLDI